MHATSLTYFTFLSLTTQQFILCDDENKLRNSSLLTTFFSPFFSTSLSSSKFSVFPSQKALIRFSPSCFTPLKRGEEKFLLCLLSDRRRCWTGCSKNLINLIFSLFLFIYLLSEFVTVFTKYINFVTRCKDLSSWYSSFLHTAEELEFFKLNYERNKYVYLNRQQVTYVEDWHATENVTQNAKKKFSSLNFVRK